MLCAGVTVYSALRKSGAQAGDWIAVLGAGGGLGHLACQLACHAMGIRVIGIDAGSKRELATECGAEVFIDHTQGKAEEEVKAATGGLGVQAVLVLTAANAAYASSMGMLKFGGTLVCVGLPEGELKVNSNGHRPSIDDGYELYADRILSRLLLPLTHSSWLPKHNQLLVCQLETARKLLRPCNLRNVVL